MDPGNWVSIGASHDALTTCLWQGQVPAVALWKSCPTLTTASHNSRTIKAQGKCNFKFSAVGLPQAEGRQGTDCMCTYIAS